MQGMFEDFAEISVFGGALALLFLVVEMAYQLGRWRKQQDGKIALEGAHLNSLQTALFGLMSLLLGFDFAMASSRFDARKTLLQNETDAIGSVAVSAQFLQPEDRDVVMGLLKRYADSRIASSKADDDRTVTAAASAESSRIREQLWEDSRKMAAVTHASPAYGMLIPALHEMENAAWERRAALSNHVPLPVLILLITVASGALGFLAFNTGLSGPRRHLSTGIFIFMISAVLFIIVDLDQPRSGLIQVNEVSMMRLRESLDGMCPAETAVPQKDG